MKKELGAVEIAIAVFSGISAIVFGNSLGGFLEVSVCGLMTWRGILNLNR